MKNINILKYNNWNYILSHVIYVDKRTNIIPRVLPSLKHPIIKISVDDQMIIYPKQLMLLISQIQFNEMSQTGTQNDTNFNYYHEYCRLYLANVVLMSQMRELVNERNQLNIKFVKLEKKGEEIQEGEKSQDNRKKRFRRTADQIQRHYRCPVDTCQRSYGSEGSLNQHLKLKHHQLYLKLNINRTEHEGEFPFSEEASQSKK